MAGSEAQAGFYYQNIVATSYLLDLIEIGTRVRAVILENPKRAQYIDDIIVEEANKTSFIQVKWSDQDSSTFTLHNLSTPDEESSKPLIGKLLSGFEQVRHESGTKEVVLLSTRAPGTKAQPKQGFRKSLAEFIDEFHLPFRRSYEPAEIRRVPSFFEYEEALNRLSTIGASKDLDDFAHFLKSLQFRLSQPNLEEVRSRVLGRLSELGIERAQFSVLLEHVVRWSIERRRIVAEDVLLALGLHDRFLDHVKHSFPVDRNLWVFTPTIFQELDDAIRTFEDGFIFLEGEPGSGKSTALAMYQETQEEIAFGYFCFTPTDLSIGNARLEREAFVRSLCVGLRKAFPDVDFPQPYAELNIFTLNRWFTALGRQKRKAVFIVDGLDHVDRKVRERLISEPLTAVLDGGLPNGVLMILSSQYLEALPVSVRQHIQGSPMRHLKMRRFNYLQIQSFFRLRGIPVRAETLAMVAEVSGGIPVYLEYLAEHLRDLTAYEQAHYLETVPALRDEKIDRYHSYLWDALSHDPQLVYMFAILAARWDFTTPSELIELLQILGVSANRVSVESGLKKITHVLRMSDAQGYAIRHNSFREFVISQTSTLQPDVNEALSKWYAEHPERDEAWRHRFRHLFELEKYDQILSACNDEWLACSWADYRPLKEIHDNIDIAWHAASKKCHFLEFVRIALLKQRLGLIAKNLDLPESKVAMFLLDLGQQKAALRRVWDGEKCTCDSVAFAEFCLHHKHTTGRIPPINIMKSGLSEPPRGSSPQDVETYWRARSHTDAPADVIRAISDIQWVTKAEHKHRINLLKQLQNQTTNTTIKIAVVKELEKVGDLVAIWESDMADDAIRHFARARLALIAHLNGHADDGQRYLADVRFNEIPDVARQELLLTFAAQRMWNPQWGEEGKPEIPDSFLNVQRMGIESSLLTIYDRLRILFLADETGFPWLQSHVAGAPSGMRQLLLALGKLARIWSDWALDKSGFLRTELGDLQSIAKALDLAQGIFTVDYDNNHFPRHLYGQHSSQFYGMLWSAAVDVLKPPELLSLGNWWASVEESSLAVRYSAATQDLAIRLHRVVGDNAGSVVKQLLQLVERAARSDEETSVIVSELLSCAAGYGSVSLTGDAERLWTELLDVSCGIYYRKDYQFNEIFVPLRLSHAIDPSKTLPRVIELLQLAHDLEGVARSKTIGIAIEELIAFVGSFDPSLAFQMLAHEEPKIYRPRALQNLIKDILPHHKGSLHYIWALALTIGYWDSHAEYDDHARPAMRAVFEASLASGQRGLAAEIYSDARRIFLVEKGDSHELQKWAQLWHEAGGAPPEVISDAEQILTPKGTSTPEAEIWPTDNDEQLKAAEAAADKGVAELEEHLNELQKLNTQQSRERGLEQTYAEWREIFSDLLSRDLSKEESDVVDRHFIELKTALDNIPLGPSAEAAAGVSDVLEHFISRVNGELRWDITPKAFLQVFDLEKWSNEFLHTGLSRYHHERLLEGGLPKWIENATLENLPSWQQFCQLRCTGACKAKGLLAIAKRLAKFDPQQAADLLFEAWRDYEFFWLDVRLARQICEQAFTLDAAKGSVLLFESFRRYFSRFPELIIHNLEDVVRFSHFGTVDHNELYAVWAAYNRRLAAGLSKKHTDLEWLRVHKTVCFSSAVTSYLVSLFDYPVVDIRMLAGQALHNLLQKNEISVTDFVNIWGLLSGNQKEYLSSLMFSRVLEKPASISSVASAFVQFALHEAHFNIRRTIAELVLAASSLDLAIGPEILESAHRLMRKPRVMVPLPAAMEIGARIPKLPYQRWLVQQLEKAISKTTVAKHIGALVLKRERNPEAGFADEGATHRAYNINTNFDVIELSGSYQRNVQEAINEATLDFVNADLLDEAEIDRIAPLLRIADPTDLLVQRVTRPEAVSWIDENLADRAYLSFDDWSNLKEMARTRGGDFIPVYEHSELRLGDRTVSDNRRVTIVRLEVFAVRSDLRAFVPKPKRASLNNRYRFELRDGAELPYDSASAACSIVRVSNNFYRGRIHLAKASILPHIARECNLTVDTDDWLGYRLNGRKAVRSVEWQEPFEQGRRRHEPRSSGFLLEFNREVLQNWAQSKGLTLMAHLEVDRTADKYKPESEMTWVHREETFQL